MKKIISIIFLLALLIPAQPALAEEGDFFALPKLDESVGSKSNEYFDIAVKPEKSYTLYVELTNNTDHKMAIKASFGNATTNADGNFEFTDAKSDLDFTKFATGADRVDLKAYSGATYEITLKIPSEKFTGDRMGAVIFEYDGEKIPVSIKLSEGQADPNGKIELKSVTGLVEWGKTNDGAKLTMNLANKTGNLYSSLSYTLTVINTDTRQIVFDQRQRNMQALPNSEYSTEMFWKKGRFTSAELKANYQATVNISDANTGDEWTYTKTFKIVRDAKLQALDTFLVCFFIAIIVLLIANIILFAFLSKKKARKLL
ncbi:MAG: DUF916 and DUF3324 domain-containing protein [Lactobacillales bacterium]|jgi:hypothetical protein|nr:DUF916 and DUF3324 domain-containing protein [Lactobacillales bacterium]